MDPSRPSEDRPRRRKALRRRLLLEHLSSRRVLAAITGVVFDDSNGSLRQEASEVSLEQRLIYIDANQNAQLDTGEAYAIGDDDGSFSFEDLPDGDYDLRLYDGSTSQSQTFPVDVVFSGATVSAPGLTGAFTTSTNLFGVTANTVIVGDLATGEFESINLSAPLASVQQLPSGSLLAVGGAGDAAAAWLIDPLTQAVIEVDLSSGTNAAAWRDLGIDPTGHGLAIENSTGSDAALIAIDASGSSIVATDSGITVPADADVITTGSRSLVGWESPGGIQLALWSNATGTWITDVPLDIAGTNDLLAFDDASGLVVLRTTDGGVSIHDANANFAPLLVVPDVTGPVALDGSRDLFGTVTDTNFQLINVRDGEQIADFQIDTSEVGEVQALEWQSGSNSILLVGSAGATQFSLTTSAAHRVTIEEGVDPDPVSFGVSLSGDNSPPFYNPIPSFGVDEDEVLLGSVRPGAIDLESDQLVFLGGGLTPNGTALISVNGALQYSGLADFSGTDIIELVLHDGRARTGAALLVDVFSVDDPPQVVAELDPLPENAVPETVVGTILITDPDVGDMPIAGVRDPRFEIRGDQVIFVGEDGDLDYENEPFIFLDIEVVDSSGLNDVIQATIAVTDTNDPITLIRPAEASVFENDAGATIANLEIVDQDFAQEYDITVDDGRFVVNDFTLSLAPGQALDFEAGETVVVNVTAVERDVEGEPYEQPIVITVFDEVEQASEIGLDNDSVVELTLGETVGEVIVDGFPLGDNYTALVDDGRFEIVGSTLKLLDDQFVERSTQEEIELVITVQDLDGLFDPVSQNLVIRILENPTPYHNEADPFDVDGSGTVTPVDVIIILNYISEHGFGPIVDGINPIYNIDVNGDGLVTGVDAILVINFFAEQSEAAAITGVGEGEGIAQESQPATPSTSDRGFVVVEPAQVGPFQQIPVQTESAEEDSVQESSIQRLDLQSRLEFAFSAGDTVSPLSPADAQLIADFASDLLSQQEVTEVVLQQASLLGLDSADILGGEFSATQVQMYYQVVKAVEEYVVSTGLLAEGVDASLQSLLDDLASRADA